MMFFGMPEYYHRIHCHHFKFTIQFVIQVEYDSYLCMMELFVKQVSKRITVEGVRGDCSLPFLRFPAVLPHSGGRRVAVLG